MLGFGEDRQEEVQEPVRSTQSQADELRTLLLNEGSNSDDQGILTIARGQMNSDLAQRKIARAVEILNSL